MWFVGVTGEALVSPTSTHGTLLWNQRQCLAEVLPLSIAVSPSARSLAEGVAINCTGTSADRLDPGLIILSKSPRSLTELIFKDPTEDGPESHWSHWVTLAAPRGAVASCSDLQTLIVCALVASLDWLLFSVWSWI